MSENTFRHIAGFSKKKKQANQNQGKNYLFVIAVDDYVHCPKLYNPVKDAKELIAVLTKRYAFQNENIVTLFNEEATEEYIDQGFFKLAESVTPDDNLIIFFSGHGEYDQVRNRGFWVPVDAKQGAFHNYISNSDIRDNLNAIKSRHTFLIADSCFSGSLFATYKSGGAMNRLEKDPSRWGLTAGRNELVLDGKPGENSPFADSLIYQLRTSTKPVGVSELCNKVIETVMSNANQTPRGEPLKVSGHMGGQFFFHPTDVVPIDVKKEKPKLSAKLEKAENLEHQRALFQSKIKEAETAFKQKDFRKAREAYKGGLTYIHATFAPDLKYIEKQIEDCNRGIEQQSLVRNGEEAFNHKNYSLALQYFEKAQQFDNSSKIKDWITNCRMKINETEFKKEFPNEKVAGQKMKKSGDNTMRMVKWILGGVAAIFVIFFIGFAFVFNQIEDGIDTPLEIAEFDETPSAPNEPIEDKTASGNNISDFLIGDWMISDVLVNGYSMNAAGTPVYENWVFYKNGTAIQKTVQGNLQYNYFLSQNILTIGLIEYQVEYIDNQKLTVSYMDLQGFQRRVFLTKV